MEPDIQDDKIPQLLTELTNSRAELTNYITDVGALRQKVGQMFPETLDFRNRYVLDEKIKVMSSFYGVLLNLRQEINKTIKEEIEIRRKLKPGTGDEEGVDIRALADMVEKHNETSKKLDSSKETPK